MANHSTNLSQQQYGQPSESEQARVDQDVTVGLPHQTTSPAYDVIRYEGTEGLLELKGEWDTLLATCQDQSFYNNWGWHYSIALHLARKHLLYFLVRHEDQPIAIFPLQLASTTRLGIRVTGYRFPRHPYLDLADALIHRGREYSHLFEYFISYLRQQKIDRWDILSLSNFRCRSNLYGHISTSQHRIETSSGSYYVQCGLQASLKGLLSKKNLKNIDRLRRKAETAHGTISFRTVTSMEQLSEAFDLFLLVEASGWKGASGTGSSINSDPTHVEFYRCLIEQFGPSGKIAINLLELAGKVVAGQFSIKSEESWNLLKIGYDESYKSFGPGNTLLKLFIEEVGETPENVEVNLVTTPGWAKRWHFSTEPVCHTEIFNKTPLARVLKASTWSRQIGGNLKLKNNGMSVLGSLIEKQP